MKEQPFLLELDSIDSRQYYLHTIGNTAANTIFRPKYYHLKCNNFEIKLYLQYSIRLLAVEG